MPPKDWEKTRDELAQKAVDALSDIKKHATSFLADHPEIKDTVLKVEADAAERIKKFRDSRK